MQALRPGPGLLNQNLPFNKTPGAHILGSIRLATSELTLDEKSLQGSESLSSLASENS